MLCALFIDRRFSFSILDIIFDILFVQEESVMNFPLRDRQRILKRSIPAPIPHRIGKLKFNRF